MRIELNGPGLNKNSVIDDFTLIYGNRRYDLNLLNEAKLIINASILMPGQIRLNISGQIVTLCFGVSQKIEGQKALDYLQTIIENRKREQEKYQRERDNELKLYGKHINNIPKEHATGELLYEMSVENGAGVGLTRATAIKHFDLIALNLVDDEEVIFTFIGYYNWDTQNKLTNNCAFAITNKRIIIAQNKLIGDFSQSISLDRINDVSIKNGLIIGVITIDTAKEIFQVGANKAIIQNIYHQIQLVIEKAKQLKSEQQTQHVIVKNDNQLNSEKNVVLQLKEMKELLDLGILTPEEFEKKKKELLNL